MDEQGLEKIWLFPTLGMLYEELLKRRPRGASRITFTAFNRWLDEDWGCNYRDRIFAAPYVSLCDVDWAVRELEWALEHDARAVVMRPAAPTTVHRPAHADATRCSTRSGRARTRPASPSSCTRATAGTRRNGYAKDDRFCGRVLGRRVGSRRSSLRDRARRVRLPDHARVRQALRAVPEPAHRVGGERLGVPPRPVQEAAVDGAQDAGLLRRGPGRDVPRARLDQPVLGGRRRTRSSTSWAPTA